MQMDITAAVAALSAHEDQRVRAAAAELLRALGGAGIDYADRLAERNRLLAETGLPPAILNRQLSRYRGTVWPRTRLFNRCPHEPQTTTWHFWHALALIDRDVSERQLRRIIRTSALEMSDEVEAGL